MQLPDKDHLLFRGAIRRTVQDEWPNIQSDLDAGILSPLGLVTVQSLNPDDLKLNHQVLAYGYEVADDGVTVTIRVYDPDVPNDDSTHLLVNIGDTPSVSYPDVRTVRAFFRTIYSPPSEIPV
jgi:hypothetical protein